MRYPSLAVKMVLSAILAVTAMLVNVGASATQIQVYGAWHCGNDGCSWSTVRNLTDFDAKNHWLIDRATAFHRSIW